MVDTFEDKDIIGNTLLHQYLFKNYASAEGVKYLLEQGVNIHVRNHIGQSPFHIAAKHSPLILDITDLFLRHGARGTEINNRGSTVLHEVLKSRYVTLNIIEKFLKFVVYPDYRDDKGKPPLAYCDESCLQPDEKEIAEKMIIQYSVARKIIDLNESGNFGDSILCFSFLQDQRKLKDWVTFRDSCITEISAMEKRVLVYQNGYSVHFISLVFCEDLNDFEVASIFKVLQRNEYPNCRAMLVSALEVYDYFEGLVEKMRFTAFHCEMFHCDKSLKKIILNSKCRDKIFSFLSKRDIINFLLNFPIF